MRRNKKLSCICLIVIASWLLQAVAFSAPLSITEATANQVVIYGENVNIEFNAPAGDKVYILVDGKKVWEMVSEGENSVSITDTFPLGEHYFEVVSENDASSLFGSGKFNIIESGSVETLFSENFSSGDNGKFIVGGTGQIGTAADGTTPINVVARSFEGPAGGDDKAFGFIVEEGCAQLVSKLPVQMLTYNSGLKPEKWKVGSKNIIEYDIKFFSKSVFDLEGKGDSWAYFGGAAKNMVKANGKVGNIDYSEKLNQWMHFKHVVDFNNNMDYLYVDDILAYEGTLQPGAKSLFQVKFQHYINTVSGNEGYAIDNVNITHQPFTLGFSTLSYVSGGNYVMAEGNVISEATNKIKLKTDTPVLKKESEDIKVIADYYGKNLEVSSVILNDEGELEITFKNNLPASGKINLDIALPLRDENGAVESTIDYFYSFETDYEEITVKSVSLTEPANGNKEYFLNEQLTGEKSLNAAVEFNNLSEESKEAILAAVVYDGDKIVEMEIKNIIVPSGEGAEPENISFSVPAGVTAPKAELYLFDSFAGNNALTKLWSLK